MRNASNITSANQWVLFVKYLGQEELLIMRDKGLKRKTIIGRVFNHFVFSQASVMSLSGGGAYRTQLGELGQQWESEAGRVKG